MRRKLNISKQIYSMEKLTEQLDHFIERLENKENFREELDRLVSIYPFSKYEYIVSTLFSHGKIRFDEYLEIRDDYINRNLFLPLYEITAPRGFGDSWAFGHLTELEPNFKRPSKKNDPGYNGEYDLCLDWTEREGKQHNIKIEVKASRANDRERNDEPLYIKALSADSTRPFLMNFQQLKPGCCDVFLWIAVYRDKIKYWVISSKAVHQYRTFTPQHRNTATAERSRDYKKEDIYEGQIMVTNDNIADFDGFLSSAQGLKEAVISQFKIQLGHL